MKQSLVALIEVPAFGCRVSAKGEGLALRGLLLLLIIPAGLYFLWKRNRR